MEEKINIAEILKDKPKGTKLWTDMFGKVKLAGVDNVLNSFKVEHHYGMHPWFDKDGKMYKEGTLCIYPSKLMRDWRKFDWKKGDVLVSKHGTTEVIFDGFEDDTYISFKGKHALKTVEGESEYMGDSVDGYNEFYTENYNKESDDAAQTYINTIEKRLGGKLNRETLEIKKARPKFKPFDMVVVFNEIKKEWKCDIFSNKTKDANGNVCALCIGGAYYNILPYEGNESLLGTTKDVEE